MFKLFYIFIFFLPLEIFADYFKWEILVARKKFGNEIKTIPVSREGEIELFVKDINCIIKNFWTRIEADLLIEGKTLICKNSINERKVNLVCRDNNRNRKYNNFKEIYPVSKLGFLLNSNLGSDSIYLELRCFF
tara:strand:- start:177 stop:578 length:402 start_codon:yes stop_codon:yes gene_type:complete